MVALFVLAMSMPVEAGMTGNDLLRKCQWEGANEAIKILNDTFCLGIIAGYTDALRNTIGLNSLCIPNKAEWEQRKKIVVKYMNDHPEKLHEYYEVLILQAMRKAFPCKKTELNAN